MEIAGSFLFLFVTGEKYKRGKVGGLEQDRWGLGGTGIFLEAPEHRHRHSGGAEWGRIVLPVSCNYFHGVAQFSSCQILSVCLSTFVALVAGTTQSV